MKQFVTLLALTALPLLPLSSDEVLDGKPETLQQIEESPTLPISSEEVLEGKPETIQQIEDSPPLEMPVSKKPEKGTVLKTTALVLGFACTATIGLFLSSHNTGKRASSN